MSTENQKPFENNPTAIPLGPVTTPEQQPSVPLSPEAELVLNCLTKLTQTMHSFAEERQQREELEAQARLDDPVHHLYPGREYPDEADIVDGVYAVPTTHHKPLSRSEKRHYRKLAKATREQTTEAHKLAHLTQGEAFLAAKRRKVELSDIDILQEKANLRAEHKRGEITKNEFKAQMKNLRAKNHKHYAHLTLPTGTTVEIAPTRLMTVTEKRLERANRRAVRLGGSALSLEVIKTSAKSKFGDYDANRTVVTPVA